MCLKHGETVWNLLSSVELSWAQLSSVELHSDAWRQQFQLLPSMAGVPCMVVKMQDRVEPAVPPRQYAQIVGVCWKITECQTSGGGKKSVCSYHVQLTWSICPFSSCFRSLLDSFALGSSRGSNGDLPAVVSSSVLLCLRCYPGSTEHPTIAAIAPRLQCRADADHQEGCSPSLERKKTKVGFISSLLFMVVYGWYWHVWNTYIPQEVWGRKDSRISLICRVSIVPVLVPAQHRHVKNALNFQPIVGPGSLAPCSTEDSSIQCELRNKGAHTHTHTDKPPKSQQVSSGTLLVPLMDGASLLKYCKSKRLLRFLGQYNNAAFLPIQRKWPAQLPLYIKGSLPFGMCCSATSNNYCIQWGIIPQTREMPKCFLRTVRQRTYQLCQW